MSIDEDRRRNPAPLAERLKWPLRRAQLAGVVVATPVATTVLLVAHELSAPLRFALGLPVFVAVAFASFVVALGSRTRLALEAFTWIGEHDLDRFIRATGSHPPTTAPAARRWLEGHPETPETGLHRVDVLLFAGEVEEARAVAERMPLGTAWQRFERELQREYVARAAGDEENAALADAAEALTDPRERRTADVSVATGTAVRAAAAGGDWRRPLAEARQRLGSEARGTFYRSRLARQVGYVFAITGAAVCGVQLL